MIDFLFFFVITKKKREGVCKGCEKRERRKVKKEKPKVQIGKGNHKIDKKDKKDKSISKRKEKSK